MRANVIVAIMGVFVAVGVAFFARGVRASESASAYSHGETSCLQGEDGPGLRLRLRQNARCEGNVTYPYLEIDIREVPIAVHQQIRIGDNNWARRCPSPNESCEESLEGAITFDHFAEIAGKHIQTNGSYKLRFRAGWESGEFKVDCEAPCG